MGPQVTAAILIGLQVNGPSGLAASISSIMSYEGIHPRFRMGDGAHAKTK